ncbi:MAG TPA: hypothetical protein VHT73_05680 [Thermodesulfobacteriota bacterium]|nr:hypothetical protein [Thermodesulfobacteriota bacterium]
MSMPGFTAETSAYQSTGHYFMTSSVTAGKGNSIWMALMRTPASKPPNCCQMDCHGWCQYCFPDGSCSEWFCCSWTCTKRCLPNVGIYETGYIGT